MERWEPGFAREPLAGGKKTIKKEQRMGGSKKIESLPKPPEIQCAEHKKRRQEGSVTAQVTQQ
jgi:hypothetical protein